MKKIININLSGRVVPIEDSAYDKLQAYLESLRRYFANEESREEIINDIESRIAELLHEKIRKGAAAVTDADVNEVIASMGTVEDFEAEDKENSSVSASASQQSTSANTNTGFTYGKKEKTRLYRDSSDKLIGGVCSGIANYIGIDPAIVRILFAIIGFGSFGFGFIAYIILWIVLPPRDLDNYTGKRFYRNPDDKIISGVAGGLAAYFGKNATAIRLLFAAPMLLNILFGILNRGFFHESSFVPNIVFGSLTGTFIVAYIVLWIVLPEATSEYQRMEMRGEKVDVNRIRQNVREGSDSMKERMKEWGQEVKESAQNLSTKAKEFANTRGREFGNEAREAARNGGRGIGHIIGVLFKAFFLFVFGSIALALFIGFIAILIGGAGVWPLKNFIIDGFWQNIYAWGTVILFLGVPLIGFIVWLLRRIMKVKSMSNYLGWTFGGLWALGWVSVSLFGASLSRDFSKSNYKKHTAEMNITQPVNNKMIVKVSEPEIEYSGSLPWIEFDGEGFDITQDSLKLSNIKVRYVEKSPDENYHVVIRRYSKGRTIAEADNRAQKMIFTASYSDSVLDLGSSITIDKESKYRGQEIIVEIAVPVGKKIRFDGSVEKLHTFNISFSDRNRWEDRRRRDWDDDDFGYRTNVDYVMGTDGQLTDPTSPAPVSPEKKNDYRYNDSIKDNDIQKQIDVEERKKEESERKLKELRDQKEKETRTGKVPDKKELKKNSEAYAIAPSPVSSLVQWF
ncbi:MAG TPA: PspC domain-containing protein [Chitinophagaceae bacterium]|jgi:phage shock protein PspC (stress-responsive transcriptional regulator)|nr:PspC domain-containing protein [Chitinophagaceae bacterium]